MRAAASEGWIIAPWMTSSCRHGDQSSLLQSMAKECPGKIKPPLLPPLKQILLYSAKFPLDCRHRGRMHGKQGGQRRSEEEQGSSCTNGFSIRQKDLHTYNCLEKKKGSMPPNLSGTLLSEGRPRPSQSADIIVTYFCNCIQFVYCVYFFFWKYQEFNSVRRKEF